MGNNLKDLTIGVFAKAAGVNVETIRFYQRKGLLPEPEKPYGSIRRYGEADVTRVRFVKSAQRLGFSLDEIAELLRLDDGTHCEEASHLAEHKLQDVREKMADLARMEAVLRQLAPDARYAAAWREAAAIADEDVAQNAAIGQHGLKLWNEVIVGDRQTLNIMTHCNAGWLATVDHGTALAPVYAAHDAGVPVHVWVSETRPRNQGLLTAWELAQHGVPHTLIADNAAGLLLRSGKVDAVIVGADRIAANGDVANKVGTYLKALAAADNGIPFYVAAPRSTLDFACREGADIPIEERDSDEFRLVRGLDSRGTPSALRQLPAGEDVANPAFDVTPNWLVTAIISERGTCPASRDGLLALYPEENHG